MNNNEAIEFIESVEFVNAKSYENTFPHKYTTRERCGDIEKFEAFLRKIREEGIVKSFYSKQYIYLELNGFQYWEMGRPIKAVQVLNRAAIDDTKQYSRHQVPIEESYILKEKLKQREIYLESLLQLQNPSEHQKKQIAFLLNTERRIHGGGKNIIDNYKIKLVYE